MTNSHNTIIYHNNNKQSHDNHNIASKKSPETNQAKKRGNYLEAVIPTDNPHAENVLLIIQQLQPLLARRRRKPRLHIHLSNSPNLHITLHYTPTHKRLVPLRLIKPPHQGPYLNKSTQIQPLFHQKKEEKHVACNTTKNLSNSPN